MARFTFEEQRTPIGKPIEVLMGDYQLIKGEVVDTRVAWCFWEGRRLEYKVEVKTFIGEKLYYWAAMRERGFDNMVVFLRFA